MAFKKVFTTMGPLMVDETTGAILMQLADGVALGDLLAALDPPVQDPQDAAATHSTDAWVADFTIPANCPRAQVFFDKKVYAVAGLAGAAPTKDGAPFMPNIRYPFTCGGTYDTIWTKNADAGDNVTPECTFYPTE